ncbi:MAG: hypothetical protein M3Q29_21830 [Chloroflexota bacterium]|nr:hypothetical protein [Chloroflexota bacterium]
MNAASAKYVYDLELEGLTASKQANNTITFADASGKAAFRMPRPFMVDSSGDPERAYSDDVQVTLTELASGKLRLELAPSVVWLTSHERAYPVRIDPTVEQVLYSRSEAMAQDATINQALPDTNEDYKDILQVGKRDTGERWDSLIRFPELDTSLQTAWSRAATSGCTRALVRTGC